MPKKKRQLSSEDLKIKKTPMPDRKISKSNKGAKFRMVFTRFVENLFVLNCTLPPSKKMTDGEIARQIRIEYRRVEKIYQRFDPDNPLLSTVVAKLRSEYNRGKLVPSIGPPNRDLYSFAYNEQGVAVNPRYAVPKPLTPEEKTRFKDLAEKRRDKFLKDNPEQAK